jgi:hypothetical protein
MSKPLTFHLSSDKYYTFSKDNMDELKQRLARIEHDRWASWQDWMHKICTRNTDGSITIPVDLVKRWDRQIQAEYADLSDKEKESDLKEVNRYWWLIEAHLLNTTNNMVRKPPYKDEDFDSGWNNALFALQDELGISTYE